LELVAQVFEPASRTFIAEEVETSPRLALDLGCGPGFTTELLGAVTGARLVVGLDTSGPFLGAARRTATARSAFVCHNVATGGFPTRPPDLVYARLLLAHLAHPAALAGHWAEQLAPGGLLLLDEVEWIETGHPVLAFYEEVVVGLVGARGAPMYAGPLISDLGGEDWHRRSDVVRHVDVSTADAARMYVMNLANWREDPFVVEAYDRSAIDDLAAGLEALARSPATGEISWGLRQVAYQKDG
jgi:trans-aconitate 2-methyltransferase